MSSLNVLLPVVDVLVYQILTSIREAMKGYKGILPLSWSHVFVLLNTRFLINQVQGTVFALASFGEIQSENTWLR